MCRLPAAFLLTANGLCEPLGGERGRARGVPARARRAPGAVGGGLCPGLSSLWLCLSL